MAPFIEFLSWFERAGLGVALNHPYRWRLTRAGLRLLAATDDHPLLPGFVDRVVTRCAGLPADVQALLADARACIDAGLVRPAIVLMGVAYEVAIEHITASLVKRGLLPTSAEDESAAKRIASVRSQVSRVMPASKPMTSQERDDIYAVEAACDFANQLRRRRNDAAHTTPKYGFENREEAEELLTSAGRHLPNLWRMA
jgi:hypothetical protein